MCRGEEGRRIKPRSRQGFPTTSSCLPSFAAIRRLEHLASCGYKSRAREGEGTCQQVVHGSILDWVVLARGWGVFAGGREAGVAHDAGICWPMP